MTDDAAHYFDSNSLIDVCLFNIYGLPCQGFVQFTVEQRQRRTIHSTDTTQNRFKIQKKNMFL